MWKSGGARSSTAPPGVSAARRKSRGPYHLLLVLAAAFVTFVFLFPLIFAPDLEPPADLQFGTPFAIAVEIANRNMTPLTNVQYTCEVAKLQLANASAPIGEKAVVRGSIREIPGRRAIAARCEAARVVTTPLQALVYRLTLAYRVYPWPKRRTHVYWITAAINGQGQVERWDVK